MKSVFLKKIPPNLVPNQYFYLVFARRIFQHLIGFHFCAFYYSDARFLIKMEPFWALFPASRTNGQRTSRPRQARPRAGRFSARGRARRAPPLQPWWVQVRGAFSAAAFCPRGRGRLAAKVARLAREVATPWARPGQTSPPRARGRGLSPPPASHPPPRPGKGGWVGGWGGGGGGHRNSGLDAK